MSVPEWREVEHALVSRDGRDEMLRRVHVLEDLIQPLKWSVEMDLNPTRSGCHILSMVLSSPSFDEGHSDDAVLGQVIDCFEPLIRRPLQILVELCVFEDVQSAPWRDLAHCRLVESMNQVAVPGLDEDGCIGETLSIHFSSHIVQMDSFPYVSPRVLYRRVPIHIGQCPQTESLMLL